MIKTGGFYQNGESDPRTRAIALTCAGRLRHVHAAVDVQRGAGDVAAARTRQERHRVRDVLRRAQPAERDPRQQRRALRLGQRRVMSVSMKPGATQLTVMLRLPTSCASDLVKPISAALAAA